MTIEKKLLGTSPSGDTANVADVFSTFLYTGTGSSHAINNGIDLANEGGLVWTKSRGAHNHSLHDSERGVTCLLRSNGTNQQYCDSTQISSFNSNGFTVGTDGSSNTNGRTYASWTFRKKEKFFTCLTYTGNSNGSPQTIAHNLGSVPAMIIVKATGLEKDWIVYHKNLASSSPEDKYLILNSTRETRDYTYWYDTAPTDSAFTVGDDYDVNGYNATYVAYLFADNSSEDADDQMIKCGTVTMDGAGSASVDLGWEPQWLMFKNTTGSANNWEIHDSIRGLGVSKISRLYPNLSSAEDNYATPYIASHSRGWKSNAGLQANSNYIYMAIRAPMMKDPEAATEVFAVAARTGASGSTPSWVSGFVTDMTIQIEAGSSNHTVGTRLLGDNVIYTDTNNLASGGGGKYTWDYMTGFSSGTGAAAANKELMWKRAKGYMDCVAYIGTGSNTPHSHSLAAVPEMMWLKPRDANGQGGHNWLCWHKAMPINTYMMLNYDNAQAAFNWSNETLPTKTGFTVKSNVQSVNQATKLYMAYLFSTLAGISKCGSYTGNGSYQTISCGFSAGSRFVLIKRTDASGDWYVWDSLNGIVAGNSPHSSLNTSAAQVTNDDSIDPANAGFIVNQVAATNINVSSGTYIFYAIAQDNQL